LELERLYTQRHQEFVRVATAIVGTEGRAVDAVQETFARALASLDAFRREGPLAAWVWSILINTSRDQARIRQVPTDELEQALESGDGVPLADEAAVRGWIVALPERQRLAVFLRYYGGCDYRSIAEALDVEVGTVSATLSAAHRALRRMLEDEEVAS
jgi:RNA polymerase sigma-70 factor (ECF subfamily)